MGSTARQLHEEFVTNEQGTTPEEVVMLTLLPLFSTQVYVLLLRINPLTFLRRNLWLTTVVDTVLQTGPLVLSVTVLSDYVACVCFTLLCAGLTLWVFHHLSSSKCVRGKKPVLPKKPPETAPSQVPSVTLLRSQVLCMTCASILAVDFPSFPRRFAKTKLSGISFMDAGVGTFVALAALVSPEGKGRQLQKSFDHLWKVIKGSLILVMLGLIRVLTVKGIDYQSPVLEYGIHWNFFFTFACVKVVSTLLYIVLSPAYDAAVCCALLAAYELALRFTGLNAFLSNEDRAGFLAANKEGLTSLVGYVALYIGTVSVVRLIVYRPRTRIRDWVNGTLQCTILSAAGFAVTYLLHIHVSPVSRRLANASYCTWMISLATLTYGVYIMVEVLQALLEDPAQVDMNSLEVKRVEDCQRKVPGPLLVWDAVNYNAMGMFLLGNVLTGLVNMMLEARTAGSLTCLFVLFSYLLFLVFFSVSMYTKKVRIKLS